MTTAERPRVRAAMVGSGFMGAAHSQAWRTVSHVAELPLEIEMAALASRRIEAAESAALAWGWAESSADWRSIVARDDIDIIDIVTPGDSHAEIALAALAEGKHVICEKPLANTLAEAQEMEHAAATARAVGVRSMVGFTYRRVPAIAHARRIIAEGRLGRVRQIRVGYRQDWLSDPSAPMSWRLQAERSGSGVLGDLGAHAVDMIRYLAGEDIVDVTGHLHTFVNERQWDDGTRGEVTVDDMAVFTARLSSGALASVEVSRFATGRKNEFSIELSGDRGALAWNLEDLNRLEFCDLSAPVTEQGFTRILVTEPQHPYLRLWWPSGHLLGYEHAFTHQVLDFVEALAAQTDPEPGFVEGAAVQAVLDAVTASSVNGAQWTAVRSHVR